MARHTYGLSDNTSRVSEVSEAMLAGKALGSGPARNLSPGQAPRNASLERCSLPPASCSSCQARPIDLELARACRNGAGNTWTGHLTQSYLFLARFRCSMYGRFPVYSGTGLPVKVLSLRSR